MATTRGRRGGVPIAVALLALVLVAGRPAGGADIDVDTATDQVDADIGDGVCRTARGQCSLRAAIQTANEIDGADTIRLGALTYTLDLTGVEEAALGGDLDVTEDVTIEGQGPSGTIIETVTGDRAIGRVFDLRAGTLALARVTVRNGRAVKDGIAADGGCIRVAGTLTLRDSIVEGCEAPGAGGGIFLATGAVSVSTSIVRKNVGAFGGGGIANAGGSLSVIDTVIRENDGRDGGGGILHRASSLSLVRSAVVANKASNGPGGGVSLRDGGTATIVNTTLSGNSSPVQGGGLYVDVVPPGSGGTGDFVTLAKNTAAGGGGVFVSGGSTFTLSNSIVAGNMGGDCSGSLGSAGFDLIQNAAGCTVTGPGLKLEEDPGIADGTDVPTASAGRTSFVHAIVSDESEAARAANQSACETLDQLGVSRLADGLGCDLGAAERQVDCDADTIVEALDNCPAPAGCCTKEKPELTCEMKSGNQNQADADKDGIGDDCDACPNVANVDDDQDADNDGVLDECCPNTARLPSGRVAPVNRGGCAVIEQCPCSGGPFCSHGAWRRCVKRELRRLRRLGRDPAAVAEAKRTTLGDVTKRSCGDVSGGPDGDGLPRSRDNCPGVCNPDQTNDDTDTRGNACDNCPDDNNENQQDDDHDGVGNACDVCLHTPGGKSVARDGGRRHGCSEGDTSDNPGEDESEKARRKRLERERRNGLGQG